MMNTVYRTSKMRFGLLVLALLFLSVSWVGVSQGATVDKYLRVDATTLTIDGTTVPMWAYSSCDSTFTACQPASVPGITLTANSGDTLNIHVMNNLPAAGPTVYSEPTSVIIPGQTTDLSNPTWVDNTGAVIATGPRPVGDVTSRVRSFVAETAVGATTVYTFSNIKAGTYLYQSGTHPGLQVQMGLYGALIVRPAGFPGRAYSDPSTGFNAEVTLVYSEIDPAFHAAVATGKYGPNPNAANPPPLNLPPPGWFTSPNAYHPKYFLINGTPYKPGLQPIPAGDAGQTVLIRFLNAGLLEKTPTMTVPYMSMIAQDGNLLPYAKTQYSVLLPAGKTIDALIQPTDPGYIPLFDRSLNLTNGASSPGGMLVYLQVGGPGFTLTINKPGLGRIDVTSAPGGISCNPVCTNSYVAGTPLTLAPFAGAGMFFSGWTAPCVGTGNCLVTMDANITINTAFPSAIGVFRNGSWLLDKNGDGIWQGTLADSHFSFGTAGDRPVIGDWTGNGVTRLGVFRSTSPIASWLLEWNGNGIWEGCGTDKCYTFGLPTDIPVVGDWNGTGTMKIGVFRPSTHQWLLDWNGNGVWEGCAVDKCYTFGLSTDKAVAGDWTGTGTTKIGVFRPSTQQWLLDWNGNGIWQGCATDKCYTFGLSTDIPIAGDWTGTGTAKLGLFRPSTQQWLLDWNGNGIWQGCATDKCYVFGTTTDVPVTGKR